MAADEMYTKVDFVFRVINNAGCSEILDVNLLLEQVAEVFCKLETHSVELESNYHLVDGKFDLDNRLNVRVSRFPEKLAEDEPLLVGGSVELYPPTIEQIKAFIASIFKTGLTYDLIWSFDRALVSLFDLSTESSVPVTLNVTSFAFGNIVNGNRFVSHFNDFGAQEGSQLSIMSDITLTLTHHFQQLILSFKLSYCDPREPITRFKWCKFVFDFKSINEIFTCFTVDSTFYFNLDYPPKFYIKEGDDWNRWTGCDLLSREIIGKSKTIKVKVDLENKFNHQSILLLIYSVFGDKMFEVMFVAIDEYCIKYCYNVVEKNFPFEVNYALECINSISYGFRDDLYINHKKETVHQLIKMHVDRDEGDIIAETLHRLFYSYSSDVIYNGYEKFLNILGTVAGEHKRANHQKQNSNHLMKKIVLTPMRTIYFPPSLVKTKILLENVDPTRMVGVYVRDDDNSFTSGFSFVSPMDQIGESDFSCLLKNTDCQNFFLKEVLEKRLFKENGLISSKYFYKYHGASVSQLFTHGLILQADVPDGQ